MRRVLSGALLLVVLSLATGTGAGSDVVTPAALDQVIANVEQAITRASDLFDKGDISPGRPFVAPITAKVSLTFSRESFEGDLERAFHVYDGLLARREAVAAAEAGDPPAAAKGGTPPTSPEDARIAAMKQAAQETAGRTAPAPAESIPSGYSAYADYRQTHGERRQRETQAAEANMRAVIAERQAAEAELSQLKERKQALQAQAMAWQAEMDKLASSSARAAAEWERQHSFGAYVGRFFGTVLQTAVGSFTAGFLTPVAAGLANRAVSELFPDVAPGRRPYRGVGYQAGASATQAAIMGSAAATGQALGQGAVSAATGTTGGQQASGGRVLYNRQPSPGGYVGAQRPVRY